MENYIRGISGFLDGLSRIGKFAARWDDDFFDRVNHRYSTVVILIFTVIVSTKQYVGEPIVCWCPALFTGSMTEFAHQVCWISNTYYLPPNRAPLTKDQPREQVLIYYQWVPFILLTEAFLFQLTNILWIALSGRNGLDVNKLVMMVAASDNLNPEIRNQSIRAVVQNIDQVISLSTRRPQGCCSRCCSSLRRYACWFVCGRSIGNYLTACYIFCKVLYLVNAVGQLYLLNFLLGAEDLGVHFSLFGVHIIKLLMQGKDVGQNSKIFPRVTMCDFTIRQFSNLQDYTIECFLPINLFSEKFFIFLWFWIVFVFVANIYSLLSWLWSIFTVSQVKYVKKYLKVVEGASKVDIDRKHISCFAERYLRQDGVFYLRMLSSNTNDVMVAQVIASLWKHYKTHHYDTEDFHKQHRRDYDSEDGRILVQKTNISNGSQASLVYKRNAPKPPPPPANI